MKQSMNTAFLSTQVLEKNAVLSAVERSLAMIEFDPQGRVLWANDNFARAMGYRTDELPGRYHRQFCMPAFAASAEYNRLWESLRSGRQFQDKIQRVAKDGRSLWLEATYMPVLDDEGRVQAVLKIATDITVRETNTEHLTRELQDMSADLKNRAAEGISRNQEVADAIERTAQEGEANLVVLGSLENQARAIRGIVQTIRDISSQTNLLALNAAIEAAHAGEFGRGFNVVAKEVRLLAERVREATEEAHTLVEGITEQVQKIGSGTERSRAVIADSQKRIQQALNEFMGIGEASVQLDLQAKALGEL